MATVQELTEKAAKLQATVDTLQAKVAAHDAEQDAQAATDKATIESLTAQVAALQAIIDAGGTITPEALQPIADSLQATIDDLEATP